MKKNIKNLIPIKFRIWARHSYNNFWGNRRLNNPLFGLLFDISGGIYKERNCTFEISKELTSIGFRSRFYFHSYESDDIALVEKYIQKEDAVLELGACIGFLACITNKMLINKERHVVVEANPLLIPWIERNKQRNGCKFQIEHCLVSEKSDGIFYIHDLIVGGSATRKTERSVTVPVKSTATILEQAEPTAMIVNIEGGELQFLREAKPWLKNVRLAIVDMHDFIIGKDACDECRSILSDAGLTLIEKPASIEIWMRQP